MVPRNCFVCASLEMLSDRGTTAIVCSFYGRGAGVYSLLPIGGQDISLTSSMPRYNIIVQLLTAVQGGCGGSAPKTEAWLHAESCLFFLVQ